MIKLIAIDLDGTLLRTDKSLSEENINAIHYAQSKDIKVVLCTGRPYLAMKDFAENIGFDGNDEYLVVFNGSQVIKANTEEVVVNDVVETNDLERWYEETERLNLPLNPIDSEWVYDPIAYPDGKESTYTTPAPRKTVNYHDFEADHTFNKFVICTVEDYLNEQLPKINKELLEEYQTVLSHPYQLEIGKINVNKGNALKKLGKQLNIKPEEMMTIGDQNNDQTMIDMAGYGVAMGNAVQEIKDSASYITDTNDNDGVAKAIYHFIK
ncbi:Cof-type HAD-IIB family hydrolase [Ruoffia tabacinasalis]|uniref:HAD family phosphatase n=1 Tax=Ruoffia tabacinasalis TaxID=87458 RepID=A0ABS0LL43_9LACT|nr:Cof-type HAD-IIB family hydrolase [Ruoffia tabacinasalis]MBG9978802.1 HAD family phosphatase [Ruoffia tabacinasalis]